ncbi:MAG: hypothetical protein FWH40_03240 [Coriobacteriia bacterium]|nr:hypothetical protein [Coriobacteriia bacterium]
MAKKPKVLEPKIDAVFKFYLKEFNKETQGSLLQFMAYVSTSLGIELATDDEELDSFLTEAAKEYFIFDCILPSGKTALQTYIDIDPDDLDEADMARLVDAYESNFICDFWLLGASSSTGKLRLQPMYEDTVYEVYSPKYSKAFDGLTGSLNIRIYKIAGQWLAAGMALGFEEDLPPKKERAEYIGMFEDIKERFADLVRDHMIGLFGLDDYDEPAWEIGLELPSSPEEIPQALITLRKEFTILKEELGIDVSWSELVYAIRDEDGKLSTTQVAQQLLGLELEDGSMSIMRMFTIFALAWNFLPHESLVGVSPFVYQGSVLTDYFED